MGQTIGERIRCRRQEKGLKIRQLAAMVGMHPSSLGNLEMGRFRGSKERLQKIADALGVSMTELETGEALKPPAKRPKEYCPVDRCVWRRDNGVGYTCAAGGCIMEDDHARVLPKVQRAAEGHIQPSPSDPAGL